jgi:NAD(P)H-quinone oxidoreductase subunit 5
MNQLLAIGLVVPALTLLASPLLPAKLAERGVSQFRSWVTFVAAIQFAVATLIGVGLVAGHFGFGSSGIIDEAVVSMPTALPLHLCVYFDGVSSLMLALVSFVGWVICRYSIRYLDGEPTQGRYFRWAGFTIGAVSLMVMSGNLLLFVICWVMTSMGLHQLLLHYSDRPAAQRAAWTKFGISRMGDAALIGAMMLIYGQYNTFDFGELFAAVQSTSETSTAMHLAGFFLVIGAITKSAQFPFHTWLPLTMETPTPVSALMHAGIVNAGGYLIIRTSPLVAITPWVLWILALVGAFTACFAAVVMLTQTSVKKQLAYSTIAQMGFMLLQCGLGAFSAAMLHILAHSLYKAHAFLSSGSVMAQRESMLGAAKLDHEIPWIKLAMSGTIITAFFGIALATFGVNPVTKPGGLLLGSIVAMALTFWVGQVMRAGDHRLLIRALAVSGVLCMAYVISYVVVDSIVAESVPVVALQTTTLAIAGIIFAAFAGLFALQNFATSSHSSHVLHRWYVHASNGFYVENFLRSRFGPQPR